MTKTDRQMARDGYQPVTEGYQPGRPQPIQKGFTPTSTASGNTQQSTQPRSGGSSAAKPAKK